MQKDGFASINQRDLGGFKVQVLPLIPPPIMCVEHGKARSCHHLLSVVLTAQQKGITVKDHLKI